MCQKPDATINPFARAFNFSFQHILQLTILTILFVLGCFCSIPILESKHVQRDTIFKTNCPGLHILAHSRFGQAYVNLKMKASPTPEIQEKEKLDFLIFLKSSDSQLKASEMLRSLQNSSAMPASESLNLSSADLGGEKSPNKNYFETILDQGIASFLPLRPSILQQVKSSLSSFSCLGRA